MIVNHIHNHTKTISVKGLDHFLKFPDTHFPVLRVCGIGPLRHIVIHRIIAPVKICFTFFIYRAVIICRHDLHMGNPKLFQIIKSGRMHTVSVKCGMLFGKGSVFSTVFLFKTTGSIPGKLLYMKLIDHIFRGRLRSFILIPVLWICFLQIADHAADPVYPTCPCIRISGNCFFAVKCEFIIIVNSVEAFPSAVCPDTFFFFFHGNDLMTGSFFPVFIKTKLHVLRQRAPQKEGGPFLCADSPQVTALIQIFFLKF